MHFHFLLHIWVRVDCRPIIASIPVEAESLGGWHKVGLEQLRKLGSAPLPSYGSSKLHYSFQSSLLAAVAAAAMCLIVYYHINIIIYINYI